MSNIVVGLDQSRGARSALDWALEYAKPEDTVVIAHSWHVDWIGPEVKYVDFDRSDFGTHARRFVNEQVEYARDRVGEDGPEIESSIHQAHAGSLLIELSQDADMVVVGRRGLGGFARMLLGSVSDSLIRHAACVVVVVPADKSP